MTTARMPTVIGAGVDRVDGPAKVTGAAVYPSDVGYLDLAHAALVRGTVPAGRIRRIDAGAAKAAPGVLDVITHENAPRLERWPTNLLGPAPPPAAAGRPDPAPGGCDFNRPSRVIIRAASANCDIWTDRAPQRRSRAHRLAL